MNVLPREKQIAVTNALCEGVGVRATSRLLDVSIPTVLSLLVRVGDKCDRIMSGLMRDVECDYLEIDELWTFCRKKQARLKPHEKADPGIGDQWLFFAIDHETKLIPAWAVGKRTSETALALLRRLKRTMNGCRPQISTDAWAGYEDTIEEVFGAGVDYGTVTKEYESVPVGPGRYAPPKVSAVTKAVVAGRPDERRLCTSIVERSNLTIRTMQRRFTRLVLGFSKKLENLQAAVNLHMAYYNLCWIPRTIRVTPAMAAHVTDQVWAVEDLLP